MYTCELSNKFLSGSERDIFRDYLSFHNIDDNVWDVFDGLFMSGVKGTIPLLLKVYDDSGLCGAAIIIKCSRYGRSMYNNRILSGILDLIGIPFYLWIKFGCCMDMMSNPGFVKDPDKADEIHSAMAYFLKTNCYLTMITDYSEKAYLYPETIILPSLPHALIDTSQMSSINDYLNKHKNIKHKINIFRKNGGEFHVSETMLDEQAVAAVRKCFISTAEKSIFYLPYQDLYLNSALITSSTKINGVYYFITRLNGEFLGYQAAIKTGNCLNALHGAFDRERATTYHAYALLFVEMTRFAIENKLKSIDFGAVLNVTKQRMVNVTKSMSYFMLSKNSLLKWVFYILARLSKIQGDKQLRFYWEDTQKTSQGI
jgi:Acetyltransferase (GNAT) domain